MAQAIISSYSHNVTDPIAGKIAGKCHHVGDRLKFQPKK